MRAAVVVLVLALAPSAQAENVLPGGAKGVWFAGLSGRYIHDGRRGMEGNWIHDGVTGAGAALEGGRVFERWLSISLIGRLSYVSEQIWIDPGEADFRERQITVGPRIDVWPVPGWLRTSAAVLRTWRRSETHYPSSRIIAPTPERTVVEYTADNSLELQVGVVPLHWRRVEVEVNAGYSIEPSVDGWEDETISTLSVGLGIRWRSAGW